MKLIKKIIIFLFIGFGILWSILDKFMCNRMCSVCTYKQLSPCYFLFLFVGIIFIVCGASLLLTPEWKKSRKRKVGQGKKKK